VFSFFFFFFLSLKKKGDEKAIKLKAFPTGSLESLDTLVYGELRGSSFLFRMGFLAEYSSSYAQCLHLDLQGLLLRLEPAQQHYYFCRNGSWPMHHFQRLFQLLPSDQGWGLCFACDNVLISRTQHKFFSCIVICQSRNKRLEKKIETEEEAGAERGEE
jgi:hypothetical protein